MLRDVVDQARQGDEEAFGALVRAVGDRCMFIAHRILRDAGLAEDEHELGDALRSPGVCKDPVEVPEDASEQDKLLAFLGRDPR